MEEENVAKQVRQAEDAIIQLAREKKKASDISVSAERLVATAEEQIGVLKTSSKSLESLSETIATTAEVSKTTISSIYKDASKTLNETTLRMEAIRDDFRQLDKVMQDRSVNLQNQVKVLLNQIVDINKSIKTSQKSIENNRRWIMYSILAAAGALVVAAVGLL